MRKLPVLFTFDLDDETSTRNAFQAKSPGVSDPEMGRFGLTEGYLNVLNVLKQHDVLGTFFVVGSSIERYPKAIEKIAASAHELGNHSFSHRSYEKLGAAEVENEVSLATEAILKFTGHRPTGHRSPYWHKSDHLTSVLKKFKYRWNSDAHTKAGENMALSLSWREKSILEVPTSSEQGDWTPFLIKKQSPEEVYERWCGRLELARKTSDVFTLTCHPFIIGQPALLETLRRFIDHVVKRDIDFHIMTGTELCGLRIEPNMPKSI